MSRSAHDDLFNMDRLVLLARLSREQLGVSSERPISSPASSINGQSVAASSPAFVTTKITRQNHCEGKAMQVLSRQDVDQLLRPLDLKIGDWGQITDLDGCLAGSTPYCPSQLAVDLYVVATKLAKWIACGGWVLLQIDNSTAPADDEIKVFERLVFSSDLETWNVGDQKSFLLPETGESNGHAEQAKLSLVIFFCLLFEWHVYVTSERSEKRKRLALQDGIVHFIGGPETMEARSQLINQLASNPRSIA